MFITKNSKKKILFIIASKNNKMLWNKPNKGGILMITKHG
jgi:hypothetical protein